MSNVRTISAPFSEVRAASTAAGGTALTPTAALISLPLGSDWVSVTPRNFVGAAVAQVAFNPWLTILDTRDLFNTPGNDLSSELQDGDSTDVALDAIDTFANGDALYIGSWLPFRGVAVTVGSDPQNTAAVTLAVTYWNGVSFTNITPTDGTSGTTTFDQSGNVTWTVPTDWAKASLVEIDNQGVEVVAATEAEFRSNFPDKGPFVTPLYWTRWAFSAATEATWNVAAMRSLNQSTAYSEWGEGQNFEMSMPRVGKSNSFAAVEGLVDAGTGNLLVNVATKYDARGAGGFD